MGRTTPTSTKRIAPKRSDIEVICAQEPGWGAAFAQMRKQAGLNQSQLAEPLDCDQSTVAHWEAERYKPQPEILRKALVAIGADPRQLFKYFELPPEIRAGQIPAQPRRRGCRAGKDPDRVHVKRAGGRLHLRLTSPKVLAATAIKGLRDVQAAKLFFDRQDRHQEEQTHRRRAELAENVTSSTPFVNPGRRDNSELAQPVEAEIIEE